MFSIREATVSDIPLIRSIVNVIFPHWVWILHMTDYIMEIKVVESSVEE